MDSQIGSGITFLSFCYEIELSQSHAQLLSDIVETAHDSPSRDLKSLGQLLVREAVQVPKSYQFALLFGQFQQGSFERDTPFGRYRAGLREDPGHFQVIGFAA